MLMELLIYIVMLVIFLMIYKFDITSDKVLTFFSFPSVFILFYSLCNFEEYYHYINFNLFDISYKTYVTVTILLVSYVLGFFVPFAVGIGKSNDKLKYYNNYSLKRINIAITLTFGISFLALLINLSNVNFSIGTLFENAREYEKMFGDSWIINYMYFLHVPSMILIIFKAHLVRKFTKLDIVLIVLLLMFSFFHGIKFTVFDALFFPLCFYISLNGFSKSAKVYLLSMIFIFVVFFAFFSFLVRGGGSEFNLFAIVNYLVPNYVNLFYAIEQNYLLYAYPLDLYIGGVTNIIELPRVLPSVAFVVNDKYNMLTGFVYIVAGYFYVFSFLFFTSMIYIYVLFNKKKTIIGVFICSYILFSLLMMCYAYYFGTKYKYIYYVLVLYIIDLFCRKRIKY
ncbi:oligosaccharide repeat unit polymerase [Vibrio fluvialis]|nr:oligosaccharide repeat unit polymerase [Vibrio fluvialis]